MGRLLKIPFSLISNRTTLSGYVHTQVSYVTPATFNTLQIHAKLPFLRGAHV